MNDEKREPYRVLQVIGKMGLGGAENLIMNIYRSIDKSKVQFDFLVNDDGIFDDEIKNMGGNIYKIPALQKIGGFSYSKKLRKFLLEHPEYEIIHSHMDQVSGIILQIAKKAGVKARISHSHNTNCYNTGIARLYKSYLATKINKNATNLIGCSKEAAKWLFKTRSEEAFILRNGIDLKRFTFSPKQREEVRKELNLNENTFIIGHVGRYNIQKNHRFIVEIFAEYSKTNPNAILLLCGSGENENIKRMVTQYNLKNKVIFYEPTQQIEKIYSAIDFFLFPSLFEGMPLTLIEAQAEGLPVLASDVITRESKVSNNVIYYSLEHSAEEWSKQISKKTDRSQIATKELLEYDCEKNAERLLEYYNKLCKK